MGTLAQSVSGHVPRQSKPSPTTARQQPRTRSRAVQKIYAAVNRLRFLVGQDHSGRWVAIEQHGLAGGIFASRDAALRYAADESDHRAGAVRLARQELAFRF